MKFYENLNFLLVSILIAGWGVGCSSSFANFPGVGRGDVPPVPLATPSPLPVAIFMIVDFKYSVRISGWFIACPAPSCCSRKCPVMRLGLLEWLSKLSPPALWTRSSICTASSTAEAGLLWGSRSGAGPLASDTTPAPTPHSNYNGVTCS